MIGTLLRETLWSLQDLEQGVDIGFPCGPADCSGPWAVVILACFIPLPALWAIEHLIIYTKWNNPTGEIERHRMHLLFHSFLHQNKNFQTLTLLGQRIIFSIVTHIM